MIPSPNLLSPDNHLLVLIDFEGQMAFATKSIPMSELRTNVAIVSGASRIFNVPTIVTTVAEHSFSGPVFPEVEEFYPQATSGYIERTTMNTWEDEAAYKAIAHTGKKRLVLAGLWTGVCIVGPALSAIEEGYTVYVITDACGDVSEEAHEHHSPRFSTISLVLIFLVASFQAYNQSTDSVKTSAIGTAKVWGNIDGLSIEGLVQGPTAASVPLQVACVFEYTEGDIFNSPALPAALNGMVHLDEALKGQITELRKSGNFAGHALETLLLTPPKGSLKADKLLLIGMGDRNKFTPDLMISVGSVAMREVTRLGVPSFAFASDIKDAGIDSPTTLVEDDQIVPYENAGVKSVKLLKHGKLITYPGFPHGMPTIEAATINKDILEFIQS